MKSRYRVTLLTLILLITSCAIGDDTPPARITDLTSDVVTRVLSWTAPGDNGNSGRATIYFPRFLDDEQVAEILGVPNLDGVPFVEIEAAVIENFDDATQVPDFEQPEPAGSPETFLTPRLDISGETSYFYSIRTNDEVGNSSKPSNVAELTTPLQDITYVNQEPGSCLGASVTGANFNGDLDDQNLEINDIAVGDPCAGRVYIFFGQNDLTEDGSTVIDVSNADVTVIGNPADGFGASLASTPDFEGDPRADELVVGAPEFDGGRGKVYYVFGSRDLPSVIDLVGGDVDHLEVVGENPGDNFGFSVQSGAGILNGSGVIIVGAPFFNASTGKAYVFKGPDLQQNIENPASTATATFTGQSAGGLFGFSLALLGRIDTNSRNEFGIGAPGLGRAYVIKGRNDLQSRDLATDTTDVLILEGSAGDEFGFSISGNGDIDEDGEGIPDVIVGAPSTDMGSGSVFLYSGEVLRESFENGTEPTVETEFTGSGPGDMFGFSVSVIPTLTPEIVEKQRDTAIVLEFEISNADFGVGAPGSPPGAAFVFFGRDDFPAVVSAGEADIVLTGGEGDSDFGIVFEGLRDVNGDQLDDFGVGGEGFMQIDY
ncbi:MAG: hypothetical protein RIG61_13475 [Deltaproteobacteria bacterium]